jgi:hypothetical protein
LSHNELGGVASWQATGIAPLHPAEMIPWCTGLAGLIERREKLVSERDKLVALQAVVRKIEPEVRVLATQLGLQSVHATRRDS